jgi:molybdate transport system regulatory protein
MGMSYKRAWSLVQALNEGFGKPLVASSRGGAAQGGALLTEEGRLVLTHYRAMQRHTIDAIQPDVDALRRAFDMADEK